MISDVITNLMSNLISNLISNLRENAKAGINLPQYARHGFYPENINSKAIGGIYPTDRFAVSCTVTLLLHSPIKFKLADCLLRICFILLNGNTKNLICITVNLKTAISI